MAPGKKIIKDMEKRLRVFAVMIINVSSKLPITPEASVIRQETTKSCISIGSNYRQASRAKSKSDSKKLIKNCEYAASKTLFWMELIVETGWVEYDELQDEYEECRDLLGYFAGLEKDF